MVRIRQHGERRLITGHSRLEAGELKRKGMDQIVLRLGISWQVD